MEKIEGLWKKINVFLWTLKGVFSFVLCNEFFWKGKLLETFMNQTIKINLQTLWWTLFGTFKDLFI